LWFYSDENTVGAGYTLEEFFIHKAAFMSNRIDIYEWSKMDNPLSTDMFTIFHAHKHQKVDKKKPGYGWCRKQTERSLFYDPSGHARLNAAGNKQNMDWEKKNIAKMEDILFKAKINRGMQFSITQPAQLIVMDIENNIIHNENQNKIIEITYHNNINIYKHLNALIKAVLFGNVNDTDQTKGIEINFIVDSSHKKFTLFDNSVCTVSKLWDSATSKCVLINDEREVKKDLLHKLLMTDDVIISHNNNNKTLLTCESVEFEKTTSIQFRESSIKNQVFTEKNQLKEMFKKKNDKPYIYPMFIGDATSEDAAINSYINKCLDLKRSGDALQVITCEDLHQPDNTYVFITHDQFAFMHARLRNIRAILVTKATHIITIFNPKNNP
jgi:hypothetical protein